MHKTQSGVGLKYVAIHIQRQLHLYFQGHQMSRGMSLCHDRSSNCIILYTLYNKNALYVMMMPN